MGLLSGDVINALMILPSNCFYTVITSPPYFWVRDYGVEGQIGHEASVDAEKNEACLSIRLGNSKKNSYWNPLENCF